MSSQVWLFLYEMILSIRLPKNLVWSGRVEGDESLKTFCAKKTFNIVIVQQSKVIWFKRAYKL